MPYENHLPLPDGTSMIVEHSVPQINLLDGSALSQSPPTVRVKGWIECCIRSAKAMVDSGMAVGFRSTATRTAEPRYQVKIDRLVTDPAELTELRRQAEEYWQARYDCQARAYDQHVINNCRSYNDYMTATSANGSFNGYHWIQATGT